MAIPEIFELDKSAIKSLLSEIGARLAAPASITLIGSAPVILQGAPDRVTHDIDAWQPESTMDRADFGRAVRECGLDFDPLDDEPAQPYLQLVRPGVAEVPKGARFETVGTFGKLTVKALEPSALIAMKLVRASDADLSDCAFLMARREVSPAAVELSIKGLPREHRDTARENLMLFSVMAGQVPRTGRTVTVDARTGSATVTRPSAGKPGITAARHAEAQPSLGTIIRAKLDKSGAAGHLKADDREGTKP